MVSTGHRQKWMKYFAVELLEFLVAGLALVFTDANSESLWAGGLISLMGVCLFTWAGGFQPRQPEGVFTLGGPYRFVRHPWILARFLMVFGIILMSRLPWLFLAAMAALTPLYRRLTLAEDRWIERQLGPKAAEYRALVAGFVPQFMPAKIPYAWRPVNEDGFSWRRALWHRPGRGAVAFAGVGLAIVGMAVWNQRWIPTWAWRSTLMLGIGLAMFWLFRDRVTAERRQ